MGGSGEFHRPPTDGALPAAGASYRSGLMEIDRASAGKFGKNFADLDAQQQTALLQ